MKRMVLAGIAALGVVTLAGAAQAADLPRRAAMPVKAPAYVAPIYNWTGVYVGINGGYAWGRSEWNNGAATTGGFDVNGGLVGGTLGYNWQMGNVVFGLEGDLDWANIKGDTTTNCALGCQTKNTWLSTVRGRIGYAFDNVMPYITGGAAFGNIKANATGLAGDSSTEAGWTLGGGLEYGVTPNWSLKAEYLYVDLGSFNCATGACSVGLPTSVDYHTNILRAGLNYRF